MNHRDYTLGLLLGVLTAGCASSDASFELAYPTEWTFSVDGPVGEFLLLANTSSKPLLAEAIVVDAVTDDHAIANVQIIAKDVKPFTLQAGDACGMLTPLSKTVLVESGLVPESCHGEAPDFLSIGLINAPKGVYDIHVVATVTVMQKTITLPFTIHVVQDAVVHADPSTGKRIAPSR